MKDKIQNSLDEVIENELDILFNCANEDVKEKTIKNLTDLHKLRVEEAKIEQIKTEKLSELKVKQSQLEGQAKDRKINLMLQIGQMSLTIGSWIAFSIWQRREQKFEMNGTPTTPMFRNLLSKMTPSLRR